MYPEELIRGIPNQQQFLDEENNPTANLFYFERDNPSRDDGYKEESICWRDDEGAVSILLNQRKEDGSLQFKAGLAIIPRLEIDRLKRNQAVKERLDYERREVDGNKYHGNLLLKKEVPGKIMRKIAAGIALSCSCVIPQQNS